MSLRQFLSESLLASCEHGAALSFGCAGQMKVALFNVKYSQNLGDGLLTECLERELGCEPSIEVASLDLAGRTDYDAGLRNRRAVLAILSASPRPVRHALVKLALLPALKRQRPQWRNALASVDAVVVGGGHLLSDQDLNFPLKISTALDETARAGVPGAIYGVGVAADWTPEGARLFKEAFRKVELVYAAVRDEGSRRAWNSQLADANLAQPEVCVDPGILAAIHFPAVRAETGSKTVVALGITAPLALNYHVSSSSLTERTYGPWLVQLVKAFAARGWDTALFTNGSQEDRAFLSNIAPALVEASPESVTIAEPFSRPAQLAGFLASADLVVAHRLHACIAAYAYRTPPIGFAWDPKLAAFFEATLRQRYILRPCADAPADVAELAAAALKEGIDEQTHAKIVQRAREDVARLRQALSVAVGMRTERRRAEQDE